jgi:hypothetical protein
MFNEKLSLFTAAQNHLINIFFGYFSKKNLRKEDLLIKIRKSEVHE